MLREIILFCLCAGLLLPSRKFRIRVNGRLRKERHEAPGKEAVVAQLTEEFPVTLTPSEPDRVPAAYRSQISDLKAWPRYLYTAVKNTLARIAAKEARGIEGPDETCWPDLPSPL